MPNPEENARAQLCRFLRALTPAKRWKNHKCPDSAINLHKANGGNHHQRNSRVINRIALLIKPIKIKIAEGKLQMPRSCNQILEAEAAVITQELK